MESGFVAAVLDSSLPTPACIDASAAPRTARAFEVYRNNYRVNLREALRVTFPVTAQLVGDEFFAAMVDAFVIRHPPRSPVLIEYGAGLPAFISQFGLAATVPYLADVARLEAAWNDAYHAIECGYLQRPALAGLAAESLALTSVALHPSVQLVRSPFPVASIWASHQPASRHTAVSWEAEDALVLRPDAEVLVLALNPGQAAFVMALREGRCIAEAADAVLHEVPDFDVGATVVSLFSWGAIASFSTPG